MKGAALDKKKRRKAWAYFKRHFTVGDGKNGSTYSKEKQLKLLLNPL